LLLLSLLLGELDVRSVAKGFVSGVLAPTEGILPFLINRKLEGSNARPLVGAVAERLII
jgi:hypothetical protein